MAKKPGARAEFALFNVVYADGSQRSNRKVPAEALAGALDADTAARSVLQQQDLDIAAKSGIPPLPIKSISRAGR